MNKYLSTLWMAFAMTSASAQLQTYPTGLNTGMKHNDDFTVWVRPVGSTEEAAWQDLFEYNVQVDMDNVQNASMVQFDMGAPVEVMIRKNNGNIREAMIRPLSKKIKPTVNGNIFTFRMDQPHYLSIEIDGDRTHNLHLFANPPEMETYNSESEGVMNWSGPKDVYVKDPKIMYFGPGVHRPKDLPNIEIRIPSNTTVYLAPGAVVKAKLVVDKAENVRIIGRGILDHPLRGIEVTYSKNVLIDGITIVNPDHYTVFGGQSTGLTIRNLKSFSCKGWSDGIDLMSCSDVLVDNVFMRNSDDCIALYAHRWNFWGDSRNITVQNSILWADVAHPINIGGHGNDQTEGDLIENYTFRNIDILEHDEDDDPYRGCMAIGCGDRNLVRNILFENVRVEDFEEGRLFHLCVCFNDKYNKAPGRGIENVTFRHITYQGENAQPSLIKGHNALNSIRNIRFVNVVVNGKRLKDTKAFLTNPFVSGVIVE